jgi:hypothetical protein
MLALSPKVIAVRQDAPNLEVICAVETNQFEGARFDATVSSSGRVLGTDQHKHVDGKPS